MLCVCVHTLWTVILFLYISVCVCLKMAASSIQNIQGSGRLSSSSCIFSAKGNIPSWRELGGIMKRGCRLFRQYKPDPLSAITFLHLQNAADRPRGLKLQRHQLLTFNTFTEVVLWFGTERIIYFSWNQLQSTGLIALLKIHSWLHCILVRFLLRWVRQSHGCLCLLPQ